MQKKCVIRALFLVLILGAYYHYLAVSQPVTRDVYALAKTDSSANIVQFEPDYDQDNCIDLVYTLGSATYSDRYKLLNCTRAKFSLETREEVEARINGTNDGHFIGDFVQDYGTLYRIRGAVSGDRCYYSYEKFPIFKLYYASFYRVEDDRLIAEHYLSGWRYVITWFFFILLGTVMYYACGGD